MTRPELRDQVLVRHGGRTHYVVILRVDRTYDGAGTRLVVFDVEACETYAVDGRDVVWRRGSGVKKKSIGQSVQGRKKRRRRAQDIGTAP